MRAPVWALALLAACSNLLGLGSPHEATDASFHSVDAAADAAAGTVTVVIGGFAEVETVTSEPPGIVCPGSGSDSCTATFPPGTTVTLAAADVHGAFTGFHGGPCSGGSDLTCSFPVVGDITVRATYFPSAGNYIFVSSTQQPAGSFNDVGSADALCNQLAANAGLPLSYVSWLSTNEASAAARLVAGIEGEGPALWVRTDGEPFAITFTDVDAGNVLFSPRLDENGSDVGDDAVAATGTLANGNGDGTQHCEDWASTANGGPVNAGSPAGATGLWDAASLVDCDTPSHIYCLSNQPAGTLAIAPPPGPVIYVTAGTFSAGSGIGAADALCAAEAAQNPSRLQGNLDTALLTPGTGMAVADRFAGEFIEGGPVSRPDGVVVASSATSLLAGVQFAAAPDVTATDQYLDADVWIGAGNFAAFEADCDNWSTASSTVLGASRPASTTLAPTFFQDTTCDQQLHVLCLNYAAAEP